MSAPSAYPIDIDYSFTFHQSQDLVRLTHAAAQQGWTPPALDAPFRCLELGCGTGVTALVLAAAMPHGEFHAADLNPSFIERARATAERLGVTNVRYHLASFEQLLAQPLDRFEFVTLHGVYSWVSAGARAQIRELLRTAIAPGGLAMVSYNCQPGSVDLVELRRLWHTLAERLPGSREERIRGALEVIGRFERAKSRLFVDLPELLALLKKYRAEPNLQFIVHELFAEDFHVPAVADVAREMAAAGLQFLGDVDIRFSRSDLSLPPTIAPQFSGDRVLECTLADFHVNRRFRSDIYGAPGGTPAADPSRRLVYAPAEPRTPFKGSASFPAGRWAAGPVSRAIAQALQHAPRSLAELEALPALAGVAGAELRRSIGSLVASKQFETRLHAAAAAVPKHVTASVHRFNLAVLRDRLTAQPALPLASPVTGNAVPIRFADGVLAFGYAVAGADNAITYLSDRLSMPGVNLVLEGRSMSDPTELRKALASAQPSFEEKVLPLLRARGTLPL